MKTSLQRLTLATLMAFISLESYAMQDPERRELFRDDFESGMDQSSTVSERLGSDPIPNATLSSLLTSGHFFLTGNWSLLTKGFLFLATLH